MKWGFLLQGLIFISPAVAQDVTFNSDSLSKLATKSADRLAVSKDDIQHSVIEKLLKTPVTAKIETVDETANGYDLHIRVGWQIEKRHIADRLKRYFNVSDLDDVEPNAEDPIYEGMVYPDIKESFYSELPLTIWQYDNKGGRGANPQTSELYAYLSQQYVAASITFGSKEVLIPVFFAAESGGSGCDSGKVISGGSMICMNSHKITDADFYYELHNPITISVTKDEVKDGAKLVAKMVLEK